MGGTIKNVHELSWQPPSGFDPRQAANKPNVVLQIQNKNPTLHLLAAPANCVLLLLPGSIFGSAEMFQSCSGPNNQWLISQKDGRTRF